jgi:FkbM family methyltransferase
MKSFIKRCIAFLLIKVFKVHPDSVLYFAYYVNNIRPGHDLAKNGEGFLAEKVSRFAGDNPNTTVFDVGANEGSYSRLLSQYFSQARIYAFEPNSELVKDSDYATAKIFPIGLGDKKSEAHLFVNEHSVQEASIYEGVAVFLAQGGTDAQVKVMDIVIDTIDSFCEEEQIKEISLLKIDTEGNEYAVLSGAKEMLKNNRIHVIQFEFNEMNVVSRVFLKDFYDLLSGNYSFYRLHKNALFPLQGYKSHNEIFVWQNLVAVNRKIEKEFIAQ